MEEKDCNAPEDYDRLSEPTSGSIRVDNGHCVTGNDSTNIGHTAGNHSDLPNGNVFIGHTGTQYVHGSYVTETAANNRKAREINIKPLDFGYHVTIGCQQFAVETSKKLSEMIGKYLNNPAEVENKWTRDNILPE